MSYRPLLEFRLCAAKLLGFHGFIPPYASTRGQALLAGVNFASAAAGIREETGRQLVFVLRKFTCLLMGIIDANWSKFDLTGW